MTVQHGTFTLATGVKLGYTLWRPPGYNRHRARKYPLVLGNTYYGRGEALYQRSLQGPPWAPALAQCGAYVFVVRRASWMGGIEKWADNVLGAYQMLTQNLAFDRDQVYLFGASAETSYLNDFCLKHPDLYRGVMLLNPGRLIELSALPRGKPAPKILISSGELEGRGPSLMRYQEEAVRYGVAVEYLVHKDGTHWVQSLPAVAERTRAMVRFVFDD